MSYEMYIAVDHSKVQCSEYNICFSSHFDTWGLNNLFLVESENDGVGMTGLCHLRKALIASQIYDMLQEHYFLNIKEITYENDRSGAVVEFRSKEEAMVWKLTQSAI